MYQVHKFMLTNNQLKKVKKALDDDKKCILTIPDNHFTGEHRLPLTDAELKHVHDGDGYATIYLSKKKLQHIRDNKEGGFLPLLSLIPMILGGIGAAGAVAGGAAGIAKAVNDKKLNDATLEEQRRHNQSLESELAKSKSGSGLQDAMKRESSPLRSYGKSTVWCTMCPSCGSGLLLKAKRGKGLYLKPYSGDHTGSGIIRAIGNAVGNHASGGQPLPDIPDFIKSIPIIGSIASLLY